MHLTTPSILFLLVTDEGLIMYGSRCPEKYERNEEKSHFDLCPKILSQWWCSWGVWETTSYTPIKLKMFVLVTDAPGSVSVMHFENHRPKKHYHKDCICWTFLHSVFSNVSSNGLHEKRQSHNNFFSNLFHFSPL